MGGKKNRSIARASSFEKNSKGKRETEVIISHVRNFGGRSRREKKGKKKRGTIAMRRHSRRSGEGEKGKKVDF